MIRALVRGLCTAFLLVAVPASAAPDTPFARGVAALDAGRPRVARIEFMNAIRDAPNEPRPHLMQARTFLVLGDGVAAEAELRRAAALGTPATDSRHMLAEALLLQRDGPRALVALDGPTRFPAAAAHAAARAHEMAGDYDAAADAFARALRLGPRDARIWTDLARFNLRTGNRLGAIAAADRAVQLAPRNVGALVLRANLVRSQYGLVAALPWYDRALAVDPEDVSAWVERAATLGDLGRAREMLAATRRALELDPANADARYLQAVLAARARDWPLARTLYDRIGGARVGGPAALLLGGIIDLHTNNDASAARRLAQLLDAQPGNVAARRLLGLARLRLGDPRGALRDLEPLARGQRADSYALTLLAAASAQTRNPAAAKKLLAAAATPVGGSGLLPPDLGGTLPNPAFARAATLRTDIARGLGWSASTGARRTAADSAGAPEAHLMAGDVAMLRGDPAAAALDFRRAANIAFTTPAALRLAEALQASGDGLGAANTVALFLGQNPNSLPAQRLLGNMRLAAGDWDGAIVAYERVRRRVPRDAALLNNLAWAHHERGDSARALAFARLAYRTAPANAATQDTFGWMLLRNGRERARALALLNNASRQPLG